jgi:hypothetical protein
MRPKPQLQPAVQHARGGEAAAVLREAVRKRLCALRAMHATAQSSAATQRARTRGSGAHAPPPRALRTLSGEVQERTGADEL